MEGGPNVTKKKTQTKKTKERRLSPKQKQWITEEGLLQIEGWARDGLTNEDISKNMGIHRATLQKWMNLFPDLSEALRMGKEPADRAIENSLNKGAKEHELNLFAAADSYGNHMDRLKDFNMVILAPQVATNYEDMKKDTDALNIQLVSVGGADYIKLTRNVDLALKFVYDELKED